MEASILLSFHIYYCNSRGAPVYARADFRESRPGNNICASRVDMKRAIDLNDRSKDEGLYFPAAKKYHSTPTATA